MVPCCPSTLECLPPCPLSSHIPSSWAEVAARSSPAQAAQLLTEAGQAYRAALEREEDALTWSNMADALVQVGGWGWGLCGWLVH